MLQSVGCNRVLALNDFRCAVSGVLLFTLTACTSTPSNTFKTVSSGASKTVEKTLEDVRTGEQYESVDNLGDSYTFKDAVLTPLEDINFRQDEIPEVLLSMESPYLVPEDNSCDALKAEISDYGRLLGPDFDEQEQHTRTTKTKALTAVSSVVGGVIPFRGLVRTATGAASFDKTLERAYRKGVARRGYLKGLASSQHCKIDTEA